MRIAVDLDGVLADTITEFCRILNKRKSTNYTAEDIVKWKAWEITGLTRNEFLQTLDQAWFEWKKILPTEHNLGDKVGRLKSFGKVDVVTARSRNTISEAISWLREHGVPLDDFVRTESTRAKAELAYDVFIDDSVDLMQLLASRLDGWGIMYTQPWNRGVGPMPRIFRAEHWDTIPSILREIIGT
jgi:5'(3')-deoxyribonucleotidase